MKGKYTKKNMTGGKMKKSKGFPKGNTKKMGRTGTKSK